jgi:PTS system nitrogen regulatory IIA component
MHEIMTIEEVAKYLRVSERTVYDWAQKGDLPGGKLGTTWRFKREDVENWVNERLSTSSAPVNTKVSGESLLKKERILLLDSADKQAVLTQLVDLLAESPLVKNRDALLKGILEREELMSTGIGFGIGVPHVRIDSVKDLLLAIAVVRTPIEDYSSLDGKPVQIVCMIAARSDQHSKYIRMLSTISSCLKDPQIRQQMIEAETPETIHQLLAERGI